VEKAPPTVEIRATFSSPASAEAAAHALTSAGVPAASIETIEQELMPGLGHEAPFIWRLVAIIVVWSILGGVFGALIGLVLAATVGPEGTSGLVLQVVSWTIMGHLIVGMVAGYVVLADRTHPEMAPDRPLTVLAVRVPDEDKQQIEEVLVGHGAQSVEEIRPATVNPRP
jgi:hypothetical protein